MTSFEEKRKSWKEQNEDFDRRFKKVQEQSAEMLAEVTKVAGDRARLIECLENVKGGVELIELIDYINRTLEEVKK